MKTLMCTPQSEVPGSERSSYGSRLIGVWGLVKYTDEHEDSEDNLRGIDHLVAQSVALKSAPELPHGSCASITGRAPLLFDGIVKLHLTELTPARQVSC
jgi:hypothetical protein